MAGYFGSETQMHLQQQTDELFNWMYSTPGICHPGRFVGTDDPDHAGWDTIFEILKRDGVFGFRMVPVERIPEVTSRLQERGFRIDFWEIFSAKTGDILVASHPHASNVLPDDLKHIDMPMKADDPVIRRIQEFMANNGIAPFSGSMLVGEFGPAVTVSVADQSGEVVAAAHAYFPHNQYSPYHLSAWGGLVAVAESQRGRKLGSYVNAYMVEAALNQLGAKRIYEQVAETNLPSRKMVESSGLILDPAVKSGIAVREGSRFTR